MQLASEEKQLTASVSQMNWDKVHLTMTVKLSGSAYPADSLDFFAVSDEGKAGIYFDSTVLNENEVSLYVNITNNGNHCCIPEGTYRIFVCHGDEVLAECETEPSLTPALDDFSRGFLYGGLKKSYNVNFYVEDDSDVLPFRMHFINLNRTNLDFPYNASMIRRLWGAVRDIIINPRANVRRAFKVFCWFYRPFRKNRVLFMTEQAPKLSTNIQAVIDRIHERGLDQEYQISTWARKASAEKGTLGKWLRLLHILAVNETIFIDDHAPVFDWLHLPQDTKLVQLWHAGGGFKSSGYSRWGHQGSPAPQSCHRQYTYGICGSKKIAHFFSEVWGINTERVLNTGMPRMDEYLDPAYREEATKKLYETFPMCKGKKVILFAPTYRGKSNKDAHYPYELIDWERLDEVCGDEYVVLFKMHPWVIEPIEIPEKYKDKMMDVQTYPNINDFFYITDLLITDYSSNIYEYSLMRRPMLFYAFDEIQYSFSRGFHRPYRESAPGKVCETFAQLMDAIEQKDFEFEKVEYYIDQQFDHFDSNASDRVIDWLLLGNIPQDLTDAIDAREDRMRKMAATDFKSFAVGA